MSIILIDPIKINTTAIRELTKANKLGDKDAQVFLNKEIIKYENMCEHPEGNLRIQRITPKTKNNKRFAIGDTITYCKLCNKLLTHKKSETNVKRTRATR